MLGETGSTHAQGAAGVVRLIGLVAGPILGLLCYLILPESFPGMDEGEVVAFSQAGRATLAVMVWMAVWWLTEAIHISATSLLPIAVFPTLGIATIGSATSPYASDIIFLFMGGFLLALSMQRWGLDRRIALITLRRVGTKPAAIIAGFMVVTAVLSMWVSNTATAAMMLPIALSVIRLAFGSRLSAFGGGEADQADAPQPPADRDATNFSLSLMLGIAYAASIGGIGTIIGSPPNGILVRFIKQTYGVDIGFADWLLIGMPFVIVFLPIAWAVITWVLYPIGIKRIEGGRELFEREYRALGPMKRGEWATFIVFMLTATTWIIRPILSDGLGAQVDEATGETVYTVLPPLVPWLSDAGIAIIAGLLLFVIPVNVKASRFVMNWETAVRLPWGILILFGGGLSLAAAVQANGVAEFFGAQATVLRGAPLILLVLTVAAAVIFLTEFTSNTATTATLVPILAGLAPGLGVDPDMLIFPATIAASCAFMMPVATPPNAIVFGSGYITIPQMVKAGIWMNLIGVVLITLIAYAVVLPLLASGS